MRLPELRGMIRRRILVNFRVDPEVLQKVLPHPFSPKLHQGSGIAGICLIRLEHMHPRLIPIERGLASENAAHRIAVQWTEKDETREGVFVPRRDTNSRLNAFAGGRLFPGDYRHAAFEVCDEEGRIDFHMKSDDGEAEVRLVGKEAQVLPTSSRFDTLEEASAFFEAGSLGFSPAANGIHLDAMLLETETWVVKPLDVEAVFSSYFADSTRFPAGSVEFDCALLMRDIPHDWKPANRIEPANLQSSL